MARMARSYSSRALAIDSRVYISVLRGDSWPSRSWTVSSGRPEFRASVAQGAAWLSGSHHAAERDGYPKPVVAPTGFEPVFQPRSRFRQVRKPVAAQLYLERPTRLKPAA